MEENYNGVVENLQMSPDDLSKLKTSIKESELNEILEKLRFTRPGAKKEIKDLVTRMSKKYDAMESQLTSEIKTLMLEKENLKKECNLYKIQLQDVADDKQDYVSFIKTKQLVKEHESSIAELQKKLLDSESAARAAGTNANQMKLELEKERKKSSFLAEANARYVNQIEGLNRSIAAMEEKVKEQAETYTEYQLMHTTMIESLDEELNDVKTKLRQSESMVSQVTVASTEFQEQSQKLLELRDQQIQFERKVKECQIGLDYSIARLQKAIENMSPEDSAEDDKCLM